MKGHKKKIGLTHGPSFLCLVPISLVGLVSAYVIVNWSPVSALDHCYPCVFNYTHQSGVGFLF